LDVLGHHPPPTPVKLTPPHLLIVDQVVRDSRGRGVRFSNIKQGLGGNVAEQVRRFAGSISAIYNRIIRLLENNIALSREYLSHVNETYEDLNNDIKEVELLDGVMNGLANYPPMRTTNADTIRYYQNVWDIHEKRMTIYTKLEQEEIIMKFLEKKLVPPIVGGKYKRVRKSKRRYTMRR